MRRALTTVAALALLGAAPAPAAAPVKGPVAVLPFKNLGGDAGLDWLGNGIAETMVSDLRRSGKTTLVERDQVAAALAEILTQQAQGTEESTAARVGRLVGAKTIVVGGYQQAGRQLRINARFVEVETGVILDSVKATGSMDDVFAVQDQVVAKLLGLPPKAGAAKAPGKTAPRSVEAYRLYAMSTVTLSDAQRESYLKRALEIDPDFSYASEALDRLEERLASYAKRAETALDERHRTMRARLRDTLAPEDERRQLAITLLTELIQRRRFRIAAEEAKRIYDLPFAPAVNMDPHEWASHALVLAHKELKREDLALQYAERHMQEFPSGPTFTSVEVMAKDIVQRRKQAPIDLAKRQAEHARIDNDLAEREKRGLPIPARERALHEVGKCTLDRYTIIPLETEEDCRTFLERFAAEEIDADVRLRARYYRALALYELGRFREAKAEIDAIEGEAPQFATEFAIRMATSFWIVED